ncbi:histidine phosphotransferase family protein [Pyruvatibacter sp.]|uniref:histidine phosphotransferase family protein n=1 Tax=Pyruvatibacter sp. TaxID=1981328 RepID=UPI0032EFDDE3
MTSNDVKPDDLEFAALLCSRVCHDVISPVGAIVNGLEVLEEEDDDEMREHALLLIAKSALQASAKLQFARLAFGASGSAGAEIEIDDARRAAEGLMAGGRITLAWDVKPGALHKTRMKLLMNLVQFATGAIPRGGELKIIVENGNDGMVLVATGDRARVPEHSDLASGMSLDAMPDSRAVQPYLIGLLCRALHASLAVSQPMEDGPVTFALTYGPDAENITGMIG